MKTFEYYSMKNIERGVFNKGGMMTKPIHKYFPASDLM